jgi:NTE family protein
MRFFGGNGDRSPHDAEGGGAAVGEEPEARPLIGLALGGGAARGWAHIGVLRALDEHGIRPDIIAGTSIGAVVGGCSIAGVLDSLETFARGLTRRRVFNLLDINFAGSGLLGGSKLSRLLDEQLAGLRIENLPRRFICVATELQTGHEIWISKGPLVDGMRASYALPGIFQPMQLRGRWLVDGALVNPIPVSVCRALGANVVIAVNLSADVFGRGTVVHDHSGDAIAETAIEQATPNGSFDARQARRALRRQLIGREQGPPGISAVMVESFNIIQDRIARSRLAGDPPDIMIGPRLGKLGLFEFHRAAEMIAIGYDTTNRMAEEIKTTIAAMA